MESLRPTLGEVVGASKRMAQRAVDIGSNRLELLIVELHEERDRLLLTLIMALGAAALALLAGFAFTLAIMVMLSGPVSRGGAGDSYSIIRRGSSILIFEGGSIAADLGHVRGLSRPIAKGPRMSHPKPSLKPIQIRKELLVAEAEVLRSQMGQDLDVIRQGITAWEGQAKSVASYATIAATVLATFSAFRRAPQADSKSKRSVFSTLLAGARMAFTVWGAFRLRQR